MAEWILGSSVLALIVIVIRSVLRGRVSPGIQMLLWGLLLVRLLVPVSLGSSPVSVANALSPLSASSAASVPPDASPAAASTTEKVSDPETPDVIRRNPAQPDTSATAARDFHWTYVVRLIWYAGIVLVGLWFLLVNLRFWLRLLRMRSVCSGIADIPLPVYVCRGLTSPCIFGFLQPAIYLTPELIGDKAALGHVLAHEISHYRHGDCWWALLRGLALALHWYNPLIWWAAALSRRDMEFFADAGAIRTLGEAHRFAYGRTLVELIARRTQLTDLFGTATTMTDGKRGITERVKRITTSPKMHALVLILLLLISITAASCTFTGADLVSSVSLSNAPDTEHSSVSSATESAIHTAILDYMDTGWWQGGGRRAGDHAFAAFSELARLEAKSSLTLYGVSLYRTYAGSPSGAIIMESFSFPCAITLDLTTLELIEFWVPGDGAYHDMDILEKFPEDAAARLLEDETFLPACIGLLADECDAQASSSLGSPPAVAVISGSQYAVPGESFLWATTWCEHGWLAVDGMGFSYLAGDETYLNSLPSLTLGADGISVACSIGWSLYRAELIHTDLEGDLQSVDFLTSDIAGDQYTLSSHALETLEPGTYFVLLYASREGDYIEAGKDYERFGNLYAFCLAVPNSGF